MIFNTNERKDYDDKENGSPSSSSFLAPTDTKQRILQILLNGPKSLGEITDELKIQKSAVRNHLESLKTERMVESQFKIERLGRPRKIYQLTGNGRELSFPRKYDLMLSLIIAKIIQTNGEVQVRKIIEDIADDMASKIKSEINKRDDSRFSSVQRIEESLKVISSISNDMGFVSSIAKERNGCFSIVSKNCILHRTASDYQDIICHGFHDRIIRESLREKNSNIELRLDKCIALGDSFSRHTIIDNSNSNTQENRKQNNRK